MELFQSLFILLAISYASLQFDQTDNWAASIVDYSKNYKFMSITELFLCNSTATLNEIRQLVKRLNSNGIYCNVNLIEHDQNENNENDSIAMTKILASINIEYHPIMLVDTNCSFTSSILKLVNFLSSDFYVIFFLYVIVIGIRNGNV